ncbi:MAG: carbohydrate ABC transporter permease [Christensenellales bacterium]|jgi:raffinose/stachyose/melibiose transport system permease protein
MKKSKSEIVWLVIKYIAMIFFAISCLFPIFWLVLSSFKTNQELYMNAWGLPKTFSFVNYRDAIVTGGVLRYFGNSAIIAVSVVIITSILATMASYAITRMDWKLSKFVYTLFLMGMMVPIYGLIIPLFSIFKKMGIINTRIAVIIPQIALGFPMSIFIICGFMRSIPRELEEASVIDGCMIFQLFGRVILPICRSSIVTVMVVQFINVWNDLLLPRIFLTDQTKMTLPVGLTNFRSQYSTNYVGMIAAVVLTIIPSIIVYVALHRQIMEGMVAGAVKG